MPPEISFKDKIISIVKGIKEGQVKTYKEIAQLAGKPKAYRLVARILSQNRSPLVPCHRVVKNDRLISGYYGSIKNSWKKLALLLREGVIAVMPTDTLYGICGTALRKEVVEKIYRLKKESPQRPMTILISSLADLEIFGVVPDETELKILKKLWPGEISVILPIRQEGKIKEFDYLHRKTNELAFRLPKPNWLINILKISGPLVASSANWENHEPANTIGEAKKYFNNEVVYYDRGKTIKKSSTLIRLEGGKIEVLREGKSYSKIKKLINGEEKLIVN